jgi:hypothetical protein
MAAWPVGLFWALDFVKKSSVSSLIVRLGFAAILGGAFFTAIWGRHAANFLGFFVFAFCLADLGRLAFSMHVRGKPASPKVCLFIEA